MSKEHLASFRRRPTLLIILSLAVFTAVGILAWRLHKPPALYRVTILPAHLLAERLNDHGQVVGLVYESGSTHPFLWDRTHSAQDLGFVGGCHGGLWINNAGQVAGAMPTEPNCSEAFLWEPGKGVTMLGTLGGRRSYVNAMNNRGQIAGIASNADGSPRPFLWDKETGMKEVPRPAGTQYCPEGINDAGQVLVRAIKRTPSLSYDHSWFLLDPNGPKSIAPLPRGTFLRSINARFCIAAVESDGRSAPYLHLRDEHGNWRRLFPMNSHGATTRLNDRNQIAYSECANDWWEQLWDRLPRWLVRPRMPSFATESYLWDPARGRISLNRYLKGIKEFHVEDLNNNGCIVGTGEGKDGRLCSVLLEPIPERWAE